ncbi:matrin-3-like [Hemitrygon akajei]|uniref:matrin-3-like n=1 Tax=Hemitrygon akajei TaxID=2704970 RepID=UPI003BFA0566
MSGSQNIIGYAKKVHFQEANVKLFMPEKSHIVQAELEKLGHIPYGTIHLGRDRKTEQDMEACQSIEQPGARLQSQWQISGGVPSYKISSVTSDLPFSEARQQNQTSTDKKSVGLQKTSNSLTALGRSSRDLGEVESYPKDKLTLDSLPNILKQIKKKRAILKHNKGDSSPQQSQSNMASRDDGIGEKKSTERNLEGLDTVRKPLVNYEYDPSSGESSAGSEQEGKSTEIFHKKERHFSESPRHLSKFDSDSESESDYDVEEVPFPCAEDQSVLEKKRRTPILQNIKDFLGYFPVVLPHCCSLCDKTIDTLQDWNQHTNDPLHKLRCLLLQRVYPDWDPGELPAAKKNPFEKGKISTDQLKSKVKMKTNADIPVQSRRENLRNPHSRIVVLGNLPSSGFSDFDTVRLGSTFGKVLKYLKVGEKAFLKMDSEMACNNIVEHFKKKPLFYGRLLTVDISSSQIQPLLKKPSAKIEELLNKVNQADMSTKECYLGPILKDKPDNLKKHLMSESERKSSESSERKESHSSDESSEATDWKSTRTDEIMQQRDPESYEIMEHQSHTNRLQGGDPVGVMWRDDIARSEWWEGCERECRTSHERAQQRGNVERDEWKSSSEKGDWDNSGEIWEWRASTESDSRVHRGSNERAMWGVSERVEGAWGVSMIKGSG